MCSGEGEAVTGGPPDLVSRPTRSAFRELATGLVLGAINDVWQDEGFAPTLGSRQMSGERRTLYQSYLDSVAWTDAGQVSRALRAFERTAEHFEPHLIARIKAFRLLEGDGFRVSDEGVTVRITRASLVGLRDGAMLSLADPAALREGLDRIERAVDADDPAQAIGSAKELVETTAKLVLRERGVVIDEKDDLPKLVRLAQKALAVHPGSREPGPDGSEAVTKVLGGAAAITIGLAELRNRGYGTGHGPSGPRVGLTQRHAHMAVTAARLWCEFMLDTLADPRAPWRSETALQVVSPE